MHFRSCGVPNAPDTSPLTVLARLSLKTSRDVVAARQTVAREMKARGTSTIRVTRFATAVSEIARNAIVHGDGGEISICIDARKEYLLVECRDRGRGIGDVEQAMIEGFTTAGGLGRGLGGARRLSHGFEIVTAPGEGTLVRMSAKL
ncbi:ATP-binding protein [Thioclava atlantica]|uniref:ATP-binding protein n=1 Tax=Thioclava atlantica TaxID=1317124 RepID=UPI0009E09AC5|nr:ATP-binding protein [Thioclava atlantica]